MCGMLHFIAKGQISGRIELISKGPDRKNKIENFLKDLCDEKQHYVDVLVKHGAVSNKFEELHLRKHWFPQEPDKAQAVWWQDLQPIEPVARKSMILAFEIALERGLPVDAFWICRPGETHFDATVTWNEAQVNRILFTPAMPESVKGFDLPVPEGVSREDSAGIYVVEQDDSHRSASPSPELIETREHPQRVPIEALQHLANN